MKRRSKRGASVAFSTVLAFALVILGIGFVSFSMIMGGQNETKNAVDAGILNVARKALDDVNVSLSSSPNQKCFNDCTTDSYNPVGPMDNNINLRRINRVWAKAMLININAEAAQNDTPSNVGSGQGSATQAFSGAEDISNQLADKLTTASNLFGFFEDFAKANSVRMIGKDVQVNTMPGGHWTTSLMERDNESNITLSNGPNSGLPPGYTLNADYSTTCTRNPAPPASAGLKFLKGYKPLNINNKTFWQVPFLFEEKNHLVSRSIYDADMTSAKPTTWGNPVPNAFSAEGSAVKSGNQGQRAISWALSNPHQTFKLSMPRSFMHIKVDKMYSHWFFFPTGYPPVEFGAKQEYGYTTDSQFGPTMPAGGVLCASVSAGTHTLGLEVVGRTLDGIIFSYPEGNTAKVEGYMVNRINEMVGKPGVAKSASDLHSVLSNPMTTGWLIAGEKDFYLFSPDGENLTVQPKTLAIAMAPWLNDMINETPDGTETKIIDDATFPMIDIWMPTVVPDPFCVLFFNMGWGTYDKDVYWQPGTGFNGNLGRIRVKRWTELFNLGICTPII